MSVDTKGMEKIWAVGSIVSWFKFKKDVGILNFCGNKEAVSTES